MTRRFSGAYPVLVTPFDGAGDVDLPSLRRLVEVQVEAGVAGVVCFGLASECYKLSDAERTAILGCVVEAVAGRVEVIAGTEHTSAEVAAQRSAEAVRYGASALMLFPPTFVRASPAGLLDHFESVARAVPGVPVIVQDAPAWTGVDLPVPLLVELARRVPQAAHVKVESLPTAAKMGALEASGLECIGGYGALHLAEEFSRGITATMPGCAYPSVYVRMLADRSRARQEHHRLLPLTVFAMSSLDVFVSLHKRILWQRGVLASPGLRRPFAAMDEAQLAYADALTTLLDGG
jgi:4-hydroxy-tetrahydrodipicolinate synthase